MHSYIKPRMVDIVREQMKTKMRSALEYVEEEKEIKIFRETGARYTGEQLAPNQVIPFSSLKQTLDKTH